MKDVSNKKIKIGDHVATTFDGYAHLEVVKVIGFTESKIRVEHGDGWKLKFPTQVSLVECEF